jgi:hypothetical protein
MHAEIWIRWYMTAFFVLFGAYLIWKRACLAQVGPLVQRPPGGPAAERFDAAVERREELESIPGEAIGWTTGGSALIAALLCAFTRVTPTLLYALVCLVLAGSLAAAYFSLRRNGARRVASLQPRRQSAAIPSWLGAAAALGSVLPLMYLDLAPLAAVVTTAAALTIAIVGVRVAQLPAMLPGDDPEIDAYLDRRLRAVRAVNLIATSTAPPFVFVVFTAALSPQAAFAGWHASATLGAAAFLLVAACAGTVWQFVVMRRGPSPADVLRWAHTRG